MASHHILSNHIHIHCSPTFRVPARYLEPLSTEPSVIEVQRCLWLIHRNHVTGTEDLHEGEVTTSISELAILVAVIKLQVLDGGSLESLLPWPLKSQRPSLVTEPVADEISITSVDKNWNLLENAWNKTVEWLHPLLSRLAKCL